MAGAIRRTALAAIAVLALGWAAVLLARAPPRTPVSRPTLGAAMRFSLVDTAGRPVTAASYRGQWLLLYFGYASCPDVCPTALQTLAAVLEDLGPADPVAAAFVTIDPARDTPAALAQYVRLFDGRLGGLTGTAAQLNAIQRQFDVRIATSSGLRGYPLLHSSSIYLLTPAGRLADVFPAGMGAEALGAALMARMAVADKEG